MHDRISIAWNGLPFYAARLIRSGIDRINTPVDVIGSKPSVPIEGMEEALGQPIHWIDSNKPLSWKNLKVPIPATFFHTGWNYAGFNALAKEVRETGGRTVALIDNSWKNSYRQWIGALVFRALYRQWFDAVWVPGKSGRQLCRLFGMQDDDIYEGMYGADPEVFYEGGPLYEREKKILFVGQLIHRKGIDLLIDAFRQFRTDNPNWTLLIIGEGEISTPRNEPGIHESGFAQPEELAKEMRKCRFLVLPSREDHWGLVVHEAALSGCALIVSDNVGAAPDLVTSKNGIVHRSNSVKDLEKALRDAANKDNKWLASASKESRNMAMRFGPEIWGDNFKGIVTKYNKGMK